jgi:hypothetical protein
MRKAFEDVYVYELGAYEDVYAYELWRGWGRYGRLYPRYSAIAYEDVYAYDLGALTRMRMCMR